ncbi:MAG: hypothetical protein H7318_15250 [Oligoflexus sp.]|nr:hypothetical protein [Oligoflexus sp.]
MSIRTKDSWRISCSILVLLTSLWTSASYSCPGLLLGQHLPFNDRSLINRNRLALYVKSGRSWHPIPMQLDPLDKEGSLQFPKNPAWKSDPLTLNDRLSFNIDRFSERYDGKNADALPCGPREMVELSYQGKYAYLMTCEPDPLANAGRPVTHEEARRTVTSNDYSYRYTATNHLVFEQIQVASHDGKGMIPVARDSDLLIVSDVKKFFTLYFDSSDIDAEIVHKRQGPLGLMGGMEFFLHILAFKIDMQLLPEVNFFEDSLFMPMSMTLPVNAAKYLRRGSGIYYSWVPEKDVEWQWDKSELDELKLELLNPNGTGPLSMPNPKHCNARFCHYTIVGKAKNRPFVMNFKIARKAAELGFFPQLIRDVPAAEKKINHKLGKFPGEGRIAIYFETARLPEGTHTWDFWIYFPDKNANEQCSFKIKRENVSQLLPRPRP